MKVVQKILVGFLIILSILLILDTGCIFYHMTGIPCPGCGMTRAYLSAFRLDFTEAFRMHPLWPITVPLLAVSLWKNGRIFASSRANTIFYSAFLFVYLGVYIFRIIYLFPDIVPMLFNPDAVFPRLLRWMQIL